MDTLPTEQSTAPKSGSSLAIIIIILIVALGGLYFWYSRATKTPVMVKKDMKAQAPVSTISLQKDLDAVGDIDITAEMKELDQVYK